MKQEFRNKINLIINLRRRILKKEVENNLNRIIRKDYKDDIRLQDNKRDYKNGITVTFTNGLLHLSWHYNYYYYYQ